MNLRRRNNMNKEIKKYWDKLTDDQQIYFWTAFLKDEEQMCITSPNELAIPTINQLMQFIKKKKKK